MKTKLSIALAVSLAFVFCLTPLAGANVAMAEDGSVSFGIRPTKAYGDRSETFSYFVHELEPGSAMTDEALVMNSGDVPVTLKVFASDGITAVNGGTSFAQQGHGINGVGRWLSLSVTEIKLEPGESKVVPFSINVPPDASPGQHVAGLVVEAPPSGGVSPSRGGEAQFNVSVIQQAGVAVVIDVPGPHVAGLEITGTNLRQQDAQGATFVIDVHNTGNVFIKAEGSLLITDLEGKELTSIPLKMDTVLPGDTTTFQVTYPVHLSDGRYLFNPVLKYADGRLALLERAEVKVVEGQPAVKGESKVPVPPAITKITGTSGTSWIFLSLIVILAIGVLVALFWITRRLAKRRS